MSLGGNVFHSGAWGDICSALDGEALYLRLVCGGSLIGVAVASARRTRWRPLGRLRDVLSLNTPPALLSGVPRREALLAIEDFARNRGFGLLYIGSYADPRPWDSGLPSRSRTRMHPRLEFRLSLGADFQSTLAGMHAGHRRNIRKAADMGFEFIEDTSLEGAIALHSLQEETFDRRRSLGNDNASAWAPESYRRTMEAYLRSGAIRFFFASRKGMRLSGIGLLEFGRSAYYLVGGTSGAGYDCRAAFAMFGYVIDRLLAQGFSELNLGGVGLEAANEQHSDHGLYRFKAGFGSTVLTLRHLETPLTPWPLRRLAFIKRS